MPRLRADIAHYLSIEGGGRPLSLRRRLRILSESPSLQGVAVYRFGSCIIESGLPTWIRKCVGILYFVLDKLTMIMWRVHIDRSARIEGGLYIAPPGGVVIGPVTMGRYCSIAQNVTIGVRADAFGSSAPTIGNHVWIGAGAVVFGSICIGDGATIGPLTLVGRNVPPRALVVGNPMKVLSKDFDNTLMVFGTTDPKVPHVDDSRAAGRAAPAPGGPESA
jgi:serine O-acetyltransferase